MPRGAKRSTSNSTRPITNVRICGARSIIILAHSLPPSADWSPKTWNYQDAAGSAWIQTNQISNPPTTDPRLLPLPPTMTITQIKNV